MEPVAASWHTSTERVVSMAREADWRWGPGPVDRFLLVPPVRACESTSCGTLRNRKAASLKLGLARSLWLRTTFCRHRLQPCSLWVSERQFGIFAATLGW